MKEQEKVFYIKFTCKEYLLITEVADKTKLTVHDLLLLSVMSVDRNDSASLQFKQ